MKIAIPTYNADTIYHNNPYSAPKFAIYSIVSLDKKNIYFSLNSIVENPLAELHSSVLKSKQSLCSCNEEDTNNLMHIYEHYALLDLLGGCSYLLANNSCRNVTRSMKNGGVVIYKIPPIIKKIDIAIKNFLIGASLANTVQNIHHAS